MSNIDELRALYLRLLRGWNDRDADAMAECFSDNSSGQRTTDNRGRDDSTAMISRALPRR